jgi:transposase
MRAFTGGPAVRSQPKLLSTKQAAELLNVSKRTILNLAGHGRRRGRASARAGTPQG